MTMANKEHLNMLKQGVEAWNGWREKNPDVRPDLFRARLTKIDLSEAHLNEARLSGADLSGAHLRGAYLTRTDLREADLFGADLYGADLSQADLRGAVVGYTLFGDLDLSEVIGLDTVRHDGPSTIGIDTIYKSHGQISEAFLRGCGVPETFIT
jgi:uncharacterized protein YjbI with pentapeptide repeats